MKDDKPKRPPFHVEFAEKIIERLKEGTAPWQKPWEDGGQIVAPHNPVSGTVYRGVNRVGLSLIHIFSKKKAPSIETAGKGHNPYLNARQEWLERYGGYISRAAQWRTVAFFCLIITGIDVYKRQGSYSS